jgi:hypothetical protein
MTNPTLPYPGFGHALLMAGVFVGMQVMLAVPLEILGLFLGYPPGRIVQHPAALAVINTIVFAVLMIWGVSVNRAPLREILPCRRIAGILFLPLALAVLGVGVVLSDADNLCRWILPMPAWLAELFRALVLDQEHPWSSVLLLSLVAPVTEELLFRGLILRGLLARYAAPKAILLSAFLFGLAHFNPWQFVSATVLGVLFGWLFVRTRSLIPCLAGHALTNTLALAVTYLPFQVPGLTEGGGSAAVQFQPWWLDAAGLALGGAGVWLFRRWSSRPLANHANP